MSVKRLGSSYMEDLNSSTAGYACACKSWMRSACCEELLQTPKGRWYCILHYPAADQAKLDRFEGTVRVKLQDQNYSFAGVWFPNSSDLTWVSPIHNEVNFCAAVFNGPAYFNGIEFRENVNFSRVHFRNECSFVGARFQAGRSVRFDGTRFRGRTTFKNARFSSETVFRNTQFEDLAIFDDVVFAKAANSVDFRNATFLGTTSLIRAHVSADLDFSDCHFHGDLDFSESHINAPVFFDHCTLEAQARFFLVRATLASTLRLSRARLAGAMDLSIIDVRRSSFIDFSESVISGELRFYGGNWLRDDADDPSAPVESPLFANRRRIGQRLKNSHENVREPGFLGLRDLRLRLLRMRVPLIAPRNRAQPAINDDREQQDSSNHEESKGALRFSHARLEKPEAITFNSVRLTPSWFTDADARKMTFNKVSWRDWATGGAWTLGKEISRIREIGEGSAYESLALTCRQLALNAEENHRYEEASMFRYAAMEVPRLRTGRGANVLTFHWWYWLMSGYGEKVFRALSVLVLLLVGFALCYLRAPFEPSRTTDRPIFMSPSEALAYSIRVAALHEPTPHPVTVFGKFAVAAESVITPVQAALLVLAIRRRFSR